MSNMPERIWTWAEQGEGFAGWNARYESEGDTEYIRSDLMPTWKDQPDAPGVWLTERELWDIELHDGRLYYQNEYGNEKPVFIGRWYGPIPQDTKEGK